MKTADIRQTVTIHASPHEVYDALMSSKLHSEFTGDDAHMSTRIGGLISAFSGYVIGKNLELEADSKIVQEWRAEEEHWPKDHNSIVTFLLEPIQAGTRLVFTQTGVPVEHVKSIADGWKAYYWKPMREMLEK